ncbi:MAG: S8 family serine peptidase [FCB group bacterium]|nr:S8 family serine peptidase [FCB group bacterium]
MKRSIIISLISLCLLGSQDFTLLPRVTSGTASFFKKYPMFDGTGITIFIMDTGVEPTVAGLAKNPDGTDKLIDVFDASRTGDTSFRKLKTEKIDGETFLTDGEDLFLKDYEAYALPLNRVYGGIFKEERFKNSSPKDINDNGSTDDKWAFIVFPDPDENWYLIMDTDLDGSLTGETVITDYHVNHDLIRFGISNPLRQHKWFSLAVNIYPARKVVSFYFEDGGHGTHVAGIAAGYHINGDTSMDGLAPGAHLVSIKIGAGSMAGSATTAGAKKRGFDFIENYMKTHPGQAVINMSYGIVSASEGFSDIDTVVDEFCKNTPNVVFCCSAGNEGPGLSTVGTPAAAQFAVVSGALMSPATGRDKYGYRSENPKLIHFSSRGGETVKPDLVSPGAMLSTVTKWDQGNFKWGTSMASPYTAGALAAVLSGLITEFPGKLISSALILEGIRQTAQPLPDLTVLDQGAGMLNLLELYDWLRSALKKPASPLYQIRTETYNPMLPEQKANSIFWKLRDTEDIPEDNHVRLLPEFPEQISRAAIDNFTLNYRVKSDAKWAEPAEKNINITRDNPTDLTIRIDASKFPLNSVQTATISLIPKGKWQPVGQRFYATVINPLRFTEDNQFRFTSKDETVETGGTKRYFAAVPVGATGLHIAVTTEQDKYAAVRTYVFDQNGLQRARLKNLDTEEDVLKAEKWLNRDLTPGIWEIDIYGDLKGKEQSHYNLAISFAGISPDADSLKKLKFHAGKPPTITGTLVPVLDTYHNVRIKASLDGYVKSHTIKMGEVDTVKVSFTKEKGDDRVIFTTTLPADKYIYFTDLATMIRNSAGTYVTNTGLDYPVTDITLGTENPPGDYELMFIFAYTYYDDETVFDFPVEETHYFSKGISGTCKLSQRTLYEGVPVDYKISFSDVPRLLPSGYDYSGKLTVSTDRGDILVEKKLRLEP